MAGPSNTGSNTSSSNAGSASATDAAGGAAQPNGVCIANGLELVYGCNPRALPAALAERFAPLDFDAPARRFVDGALRAPHGALASGVYGVLRHLVSDYEAYGLLGMYPMHLLSTAQLQTLLGTHARGELLDVGAGDGGVTAQAAPLFASVSATEHARMLARRLRKRGYRVLDHDLSARPLPERQRFDVVLCLNVLDRCARPRSLLSNLRAALRADGRLLLSVPLPLRPHVHVGPYTVDPDEPLPAAEASWEAGAATVVRELLEPAGVRVERLSRAPYLSRGDRHTPLHVLDAAVFVCSPTKPPC